MATSGRSNGEEQLVLTLASGASFREASEIAQTSECTANRLMGDPMFKTSEHSSETSTRLWMYSLPMPDSRSETPNRRIDCLRQW